MTGAGAFRVEVSAEAGPAPEALLSRAVETTLRAEGVEEAELSLTLLDDSGMAELNRRWLGKDGTTDVLAFTLSGEGEPPLGDVYLGVEQARRQADEAGVTLDEELVRLAVHGTLHVLGHDHPEGPERTESSMFRRQEELVRSVVEAS